MKNTILFLLFLIFFIKLTAQPTQTIANISADSASTIIQLNNHNPDFVILDVRRDYEYNAGHLEKAANLDFFSYQFYTTLDSMNKDKIYLIYCGSGGRSGIARDSMAARNFQTVYNLIGGYNHWVKNHPVTLSVSSILANTGSDILKFGLVQIGNSNTISLRLTNAGNDTLKFTSFTYPNHPDFTTNFSTTPQLLGWEDYVFEITYHPISTSMDSSNMTIYTADDTLVLWLSGQGLLTDIGISVHKNKPSIYPNPVEDYLFIRSNIPSKTSCRIMDNSGRIIKQFEVLNQDQKINLSGLSPGIYFLILEEKSIRFIKK